MLLRVAYDGTAYAGWQRQLNGPSVQAEIEDALAPLVGGRAVVFGAGRTDAGVHAEGQTAHVDVPEGLEAESVLRAANTRLPGDIRIREARVVSEAFHARYSATGKTYRYVWLVSRIGHPLLARTTCLVPPRLDLVGMGQAAAYLAGTHDFAAFQSVGTAIRSTVRTITRVDLCLRPAEDIGLRLHEQERIVEFEVTGDGFLRHMVRALAGTLLDVGQGRRSPDDVRALLSGAPRSAAGPTAPAHGLTLVDVMYGGAGLG